MTEPRLIRKYVNRRLYDTSQSRYVNLEELHRLILEGTDIRVTDKASGADITSAVLLQIIGETQRSGAPLLEADFLCELIRLAADQRDPLLPQRMRNALRDALRRAVAPPDSGLPYGAAAGRP